MKRTLTSVFWGILFLCLASSASPQPEVKGYTVISAVELRKLQEGEKGVLLIDTLALSRYRQEHIAGAKNFEFPNENMASWDKSKTGGKSTEDFAGLLGEDRDRPVVFYCLDAK